MADEPDALEGAEAEAARAEAGGTGDQPQQPKTVEELASDLGWKPKDQWQGDETLWQPAETFLRAPVERKYDSKRELKGLRDQLDRVTRTSSQILADKLAEKDAQLALQQAKAVEDGDNAAVDRVVKARIKLQESAPSSDPGLPSETVAFMEDNKDWFGKDRLATAHAKRVAAELAQDGEPVDVQLREALRSVKKSFPELFPKAKEAPGTQTGASRATRTDSRVKGFADMPPNSQKMARDYEKRHGVKPEDFAKSYWADQAEIQRRA
jgi:hypothetical protein